MSNGDKKPGLADISDLKARLGMLGKGPTGASPAANPFAPKPTPGEPSGPVVDLSESQGGPDLVAGGDTAVVRLPDAGAPTLQSMPPDADPVARLASGPPPSPQISAPPVSQPPVSAAVPNPFRPSLTSPGGAGRPSLNFAPAAGSAPPAPVASPRAAPVGFDLGAADDLFRKKEEPPPPAPAPAVEAPTAAARLANFAPTPAAPAPEPEQPAKEFAHPLHVGEFAAASPSVDLSAEDEEALNSFVSGQQGMKPALALGMIAAVSLLTLIFGFMLGDMRAARRMINAQIDASIQIKKRMETPLSTFALVSPLVRGLATNPRVVDWDKVDAIPEDLPNVDASILSSPIPLDQALMQLTNSAITDLNIFFRMVSEHRRLTLQRDRNELEALLRGDTFAQYETYAVYAKPPDPKAPPSTTGQPASGRVVALVGEAFQNEKDPKDTEWYIPVRKRESKDNEEAIVRGLTLIRKTDLLQSGRGNVLELYTKRIEELQVQLKRIQQYETSLREKLNEQASRSKVFSF